MNFLAYRTTGLALKILTAFSKAKITLHHEKDLPIGGTIFVINHFTRLETLLLPYHISKLLDKPVWSLASPELFSGLMGRYLEQVGAVSVGDPERDKLIIKSLVGGSVPWIVFPEGRMVKNRKVIDRGSFMITSESGKHPPRTGAAALAWRAEILRCRLLALKELEPEKFVSLANTFDLSPETSITESINIIPVNVSYYPLHFTDTFLNRFSDLLEDKLSPRMVEELMVEGSMLLTGVDIDIRFGETLPVAPYVEKFFGTKTPDFIDNKKSRRVLQKMTEAAMTAIYGLETVNLDHILAALLYKTSGRTFTEIDFRRRAYLAATSAARLHGIFCHQGLQSSQVDLLLEKDGGRVSDLLDLAREKGFLHDLSEPRLRFLELEKECCGDSFHKIRLENPFLVMANAIEPLPALQRLLRQISWMPSWCLRRLTAKRLLGCMEQEYLADRKLFQEDPELCPLAYGSSYLVNYRTTGTKVGIVLIHDWLSNPQSLKGLADYLGRRGFMVLVPRLPGHGTVVADLENREYGQWQRAVDEAYAYIDCLCLKVIICGVGSGIALGLSLAARGFDMAAILALFPDFGSLRKPSSETLVETEKGELTPPLRASSGSVFSYSSAPASSSRQVKKMLIQTAKKLSLVKSPMLIMQVDAAAKADRLTVHKYFDELASPEKELLLLPSAKIDPLTSEASHGGQALVDFILRYCR